MSLVQVETRRYSETCGFGWFSLETELFDRLDRSTHLIVLASPEAAASHGMEIEARHWFGSPRNGQIIVVVSSGNGDNWQKIREHLLPPAVSTNLTSEPLWVSLQHRRAQILASPNDHQVRGELIEDLKQVLLRLYPTRDWAHLCGEERSQRRRAIGLLSVTAILFLALSLVAFGLARYAETQRAAAVERQLIAESQALAA